MIAAFKLLCIFDQCTEAYNWDKDDLFESLKAIKIKNFYVWFLNYSDSSGYDGIIGMTINFPLKT